MMKITVRDLMGNNQKLEDDDDGDDDNTSKKDIFSYICTLTTVHISDIRASFTTPS